MKRAAEIQRTTKETSLQLKLVLEGTGNREVQTGIGFLDHMIEQLVFHARWDLSLTCEGDLQIDSHHTTEDIGIALGQAFKTALGDKSGILRYGHAYIPMDETLVRAVVDLSGRPEFVFQGEFSHPQLGQLETQMVSHFFKSFALNAGMTLHLTILYGNNDHHKCEGLFKALARAVFTAAQHHPAFSEVTSTKGTLE